MEQLVSSFRESSCRASHDFSHSPDLIRPPWPCHPPGIISYGLSHPKPYQIHCWPMSGFCGSTTFSTPKLIHTSHLWEGPEGHLSILCLRGFQMNISQFFSSLEGLDGCLSFLHLWRDLEGCHSVSYHWGLSGTCHKGPSCTNLQRSHVTSHQGFPMSVPWKVPVINHNGECKVKSLRGWWGKTL